MQLSVFYILKNSPYASSILFDCYISFVNKEISFLIFLFAIKIYKSYFLCTVLYIFCHFHILQLVANTRYATPLDPLATVQPPTPHPLLCHQLTVLPFQSPSTHLFASIPTLPLACEEYRCPSTKRRCFAILSVSL